MNPSPDSNALAGAFILFFGIGLLAAVPGTILGLKDRLVIYNGKSDLVLTYLAPLSLLVWIPHPDIPSLVACTLKGMSVSLILWSVGKAWTANRSVWKTALVLPTKFALAWGIAICALLAAGGMISGTKELKARKFGLAARQFAIGAAAAVLFLKMKEIIRQLVKSPAR